ncbi:unnamed protein product [Saimiriine gammaherpesvirus 2]|uniref:Uncharacterized gene 5 protein n=1 Tax=Saimiriine herpesvirus 2 (strain 11) TaxID=10383 RepID=VG05_SHV21|nr:unnamed protein product [Saimiriine gammaherpesvirus 2]P24912.1 RecName: Full=Uncharacterized gene 5 protein [Herpesvirus saimiri (strain 11)]pir/F36806/ hypothetical protein ORF5 - saimiriine herpesvirus 1 (strain 11) [Saimiriine alphaherpesvirus 1]AAA46161.1 KFLF1 [Saimiriine gammaherpesvirus 2]CAA45628.1 unnamed protein product [Saimiriine gammaherpesvirus 2]
MTEIFLFHLKAKHKLLQAEENNYSNDPVYEEIQPLSEECNRNTTSLNDSIYDDVCYPEDDMYDDGCGAYTRLDASRVDYGQLRTCNGDSHIYEEIG